MRSRKFTSMTCASSCLLVAGLAYAVPCPWDCASPNDGIVGINDFLFVLSEWGNGPSSQADVNHDQIVNINDFLLILSNWGPCPQGTAITVPGSRAAVDD